MDGRRTRRESGPSRRAGRALVLLIATAAAIAVMPGTASAQDPVPPDYVEEIPISVDGYEVKQTVRSNAPRPPASAGHVTRMEVDLVDDEGEPIPIQRLMLHHIVFLNGGRLDQTCAEEGILSFDSRTQVPAVERFFAAGEERAKMVLPEGYGYDLSEDVSPWYVLYMVMNHQAADEENANIQYKIWTDDDPEIKSVVPYWMDVENCSADPIYNVPGTESGNAKDIATSDFPIDGTQLGASGGRIVAGGGHVHGGAYRLGLSQPACGDRDLFRSKPTWGNEDHPFYNVQPILHEPGPINMTAFTSEEGFPVQAGESLRLDSVYDNTSPHTRVMGIFIVYIDPDSTVSDSCDPLPTDVQTLGTQEAGRTGGPVPFKVPLTGLDENGQAVKISKPPGETKDLESGSTIKVGDSFFSRPNVRIDKGDKLNWMFDSADLHNLTLANGPEAIGSPNLSREPLGLPPVNSGNPRTFKKRFDRPGTYRLFCALHPVQMSERVVVKP